MLCGVWGGVFVVPGVGLQGGDNKVSEAKQKKDFLNKVIAVLLALWLLVLPMAVSAEFLTVDKYGLYRMDKLQSVGSPLTTSYYSSRWALSGVSPDYTYDCWIQLTFNDSVPDGMLYIDTESGSYYSTSNKELWYNLQGSGSWTRLTKQLGSIEKVSDKSYKIHLYWNSSVSEFYSATIQLGQLFFCSGSGNVNWVGQGVGVYYDPGGSNYEEILQMINSNVENLPDRIKEVLEKHDQDVKNESSTEGNDKIDQAINALKNAIPVSSVKDAITPLMTACNYEGTNSVWTFPSITIPAIPGLFDDMKLSEEQSFDLSTYADEYIPETLLQLVRYLMTAGLILFAIKELMSIISQIFGGGNGGGDGG